MTEPNSNHCTPDLPKRPGRLEAPASGACALRSHSAFTDPCEEKSDLGSREGRGLRPPARTWSVPEWGVEGHPKFYWGSSPVQAQAPDFSGEFLLPSPGGVLARLRTGFDPRPDRRQVHDAGSVVPSTRHSTENDEQETSGWPRAGGSIGGVSSGGELCSQAASLSGRPQHTSCLQAFCGRSSRELASMRLGGSATLEDLDTSEWRESHREEEHPDCQELSRDECQDVAQAKLQDVEGFSPGLKVAHSLADERQNGFPHELEAGSPRWFQADEQDGGYGLDHEDLDVPVGMESLPWQTGGGGEDDGPRKFLGCSWKDVIPNPAIRARLCSFDFAQPSDIPSPSSYGRASGDNGAGSPKASRSLWHATALDTHERELLLHGTPPRSSRRSTSRSGTPQQSASNPGSADVSPVLRRQMTADRSTVVEDCWLTATQRQRKGGNASLFGGLEDSQKGDVVLFLDDFITGLPAVKKIRM